MSYNIDHWKVKQLDRLFIPISLLCTKHQAAFDKPVLDLEFNTYTLNNMDSVQIVGRIENALIEVTEIECSGEGSGTIYHDILLPAFAQSTGILDVVCIWEGDGEIIRLTVENGSVTEEDIDL